MASDYRMSYVTRPWFAQCGETRWYGDFLNGRLFEEWVNEQATLRAFLAECEPKPEAPLAQPLLVARAHADPKSRNKFTRARHYAALARNATPPSHVVRLADARCDTMANIVPTTVPSTSWHVTSDADAQKIADAYDWSLMPDGHNCMLGFTVIYAKSAHVIAASEAVRSFLETYCKGGGGGDWYKLVLLVDQANDRLALLQPSRIRNANSLFNRPSIFLCLLVRSSINAPGDELESLLEQTRQRVHDRLIVIDSLAGYASQCELARATLVEGPTLCRLGCHKLKDMQIGDLELESMTTHLSVGAFPIPTTDPQFNESLSCSGLLFTHTRDKSSVQYKLTYDKYVNMVFTTVAGTNETTLTLPAASTLRYQVVTVSPHRYRVALAHPLAFIALTDEFACDTGPTMDDFLHCVERALMRVTQDIRDEPEYDPTVDTATALEARLLRPEFVRKCRVYKEGTQYAYSIIDINLSPISVSHANDATPRRMLHLKCTPQISATGSTAKELEQACAAVDWCDFSTALRRIVKDRDDEPEFQ